MNNYPVYNPFVSDVARGEIPILDRDVDALGDFHSFSTRRLRTLL